VNQSEFDEWLIETAADVRVPPETPREEIWAGLQAARGEDELQRRRGRRRLRWIEWGVGIAALLLIGIGLGRYSVRPNPAALAPVAANPEGASTAYRVVTAQHLSQAEALLTLTRRASEADDLDAQTIAWAKDLLSTTRLLLDSPDGNDPRLRALLQDLELVLAEITQLRSAPSSGAAADEELNLVKKSIEHVDVLPRLRTAIPAGAVAAAS
jgi:hypothetical protein